MPDQKNITIDTITTGGSSANRNFRNCQPFEINNQVAVKTETITVWEDHKTGVTFQMNFYDEQGRNIGNLCVSCTDQDYANWDGNNKDFPANYAAQALGVTLVNT